MAGMSAHLMPFVKTVITTARPSTMDTCGHFLLFLGTTLFGYCLLTVYMAVNWQLIAVLLVVGWGIIYDYDPNLTADT